MSQETTLPEAPPEPKGGTKSDSNSIEYWDPEAGELKSEQIFAEKWLRRGYESGLGRLIVGLFLKRRLFHFLAGFYYDSGFSLDKVDRFIREYNLDLSDFEESEYGCFNDFFTRRFKPGARKFCEKPWEFPAFAEGRYLGFERVEATQTYPVKGYDMTASAILGSREQAEAFLGGPVLVARLAPTDYHRFHYPDSGRHIGMEDIGGGLHSVNPIALAQNSRIYATNHRKAWYLTTNNFGRLGYVEIGAFGVGRIRQTHDEDTNFARGDEKGYFAYGGSTVIVFGQPGYWRPTDELLERTANRQETFVKLGSLVATSTRRQSERGKRVEIGGEVLRVERG